MNAIRVIPESELELVFCEECGSNNVLTAAHDCVSCAFYRVQLLAVAPELADHVALT